MSWFKKTTPTIEPTPPDTEAARALARARRETAEVVREWPRVERANRILTEQLEQNNFAERLRLAMGGK